VTRWWRSHSVRVQLTVWYAAAMIVVLGVYAAAVFASVSRSMSDSLDQRLRSDFWWAAATVDQRPDGTVTWLEPEGFGDEDRPWLQVWSLDGKLLYQSSEARRLPFPESARLALQADNRNVIVKVQTDTVPVRILSNSGKIRSKDPAAMPVVIQIARSEGPMRRQLSDLAVILVLGLPLGVAAAGFGGYTLARRALAPVERMTDRARTITAERLSDRLPVHNPDNEMGRLATVFNETLGRLEASFEQMRRFTGDVSHELRTPLTAIRSVGEVGLREHRDAPAYRAIIGSMLEEVDRLSGLVDRLLTLSRAESGQAKLSVEVVDLRELVDDVVSHLGVLAEEKHQSLTVEVTGVPRGVGDRLVLRQSLINLVDNAIKYTPAGGTIHIRASDTPAGPAIEVRDTGPGIAPDVRTRIFDRYDRGNSRSDGIGGSGLGLAIAKWAVEVNGGLLSLESSPGAGSVFRMTLTRPGRTWEPASAGFHDAISSQTVIRLKSDPTYDDVRSADPTYDDVKSAHPTSDDVRNTDPTSDDVRSTDVT
jgi:heavy metal sensor kinase